jgi:aspartyl-tRNA(Asn)/glutamyl-tRNA(Gln) amidotransferase subunit A
VASTAVEIADQVRAGRRRAAEVLEDALQAIEATGRRIHAFLTIDADRARRRADEIDARVSAGERVGCLAGVAVAVKDNICTAWGTTTCGSRMLQEYRSPFNAAVIDRLEAADAIVVGKTNLDEFAMGSSTELSAFGPTANPWDTTRVAGGSSGGSAAAVSAGCVPLALGSETGGSIRLPASFCSVVGLKPSYGRVSRYGLVAFGSSLDQVGPLGRTVRDTARLLGVIAGKDPRDSTSVDQPAPDYEAALEQAPAALRIGVAPQMMAAGLDDGVRQVILAAVEAYRRRGATLIEVDLPHLQHAVACYYIVCMAEASSNLARFDGVHYGCRAHQDRDIVEMVRRSRSEALGSEVKRRIMLGTYVLSSGYYDAFYLQALKVRALIKQDFDRVFEQVDVLLSPTVPVPPFKLGERLEDPLAMYLTDVYTVSANLAGICAITIPCGFTSDGLPVGLQMQAPAMAEARLLSVAHAFQTWTDWHTRSPELR